MKKEIWPVVLYCGWFLMGPPVTEQDIKNNTTETRAYKRPLSEWDHLQSYDSAKECEDYRSATLTSAPREALKNRLYASLLLARCIPADSIPVK